jgi:hypothetical protein
MIDTPASGSAPEHPYPDGPVGAYLSGRSDREEPHVRPFLDELALHLMARRVGVPDAARQTELYTRTRLEHTPPFTQCPPGFIRDLHEDLLDGPTVACPQKERLLETLTEGLIEYGTSFIETIGPRRKRREVEQATETIRRALECFYPENRNKKLWRQYHALMTALGRISADDYTRLEHNQRELLKQWRHRLAYVMRLAFHTFGPLQAAYPQEAVYFAIASIYDDLSIEHGEWRRLADRIRKRCEAHDTLE